MNKIVHSLVLLAGAALVIFLTWYFSSIVAYILISAILSLIAKPLVDFLDHLEFRSWKLPRWVCAAVGLASIWAFFFLFFYIFIPLIGGLAQQMSSVDINEVVDLLSEPLRRLENSINSFIPDYSQFSFQEVFRKQVNSLVNINVIKDSFDSITSFLISVAIGIFAISFITFFFLKEDGLFTEGVVILFPPKYEGNVRRALASSTRLLVRYFIGVVLDMICVMMVITIGLSVFTDLSFKTSMIIGLIAGVLNVIPYVGPVIAAGVSVLIAIATHFEMINSGQISATIFSILIVFIIMKILDDTIFQPIIFSNSVNAHPLEIFLLILLAGSFAGVGGMLIAIPAYTVFRVFAKEFFNNFRVIQKITGKI